jgi:hypothetical protein
MSCMSSIDLLVAVNKSNNVVYESQRRGSLHIHNLLCIFEEPAFVEPGESNIHDCFMGRKITKVNSQ